MMPIHEVETKVSTGTVPDKDDNDFGKDVNFELRIFKKGWFSK